MFRGARTKGGRMTEAGVLPCLLPSAVTTSGTCLLQDSVKEAG